MDEAKEKKRVHFSIVNVLGMEILLSYLNNPFFNNPDNISIPYTIIEKEFFNDNCNPLNKIITSIIGFSKDDSKKLGCKPKDSDYDYVKIAYESVHGYRDGYCQDACPYRTDRQWLVDSFLNVDSHLKCYECDQLFFIQMIKEVVDGKEYSEIKGLKEVFKKAFFTRPIQHYVHFEIVKNKKGGDFKERIVHFPNADLDIAKLLDKCPDYRHAFMFLIYFFTAGSFFNFVDIHGRERLRICKNCGNFFAAIESTRREFCCVSCHNFYHNHRRIESGKAAEYKRKKYIKKRDL